jgi:hypothetical protein
MFTYRVYDAAGNELGEATYTQHIKAGETVWLSGARAVCVIDVIDATEETERYAGLLRVEPARYREIGRRLARMPECAHGRDVFSSGSERCD